MIQQIPCFNANSDLSNKVKYSMEVERYSNFSVLLLHACAYSQAKWHSKTPGRRLNGKCFRSKSKYETGEFGVYSSVSSSSSLGGVKNALGFIPVDAIHLATRSDTMPLPPLKIVIKLRSGTVYSSGGTFVAVEFRLENDNIELNAAISSSFPIRSDHWAIS